MYIYKWDPELSNPTQNQATSLDMSTDTGTTHHRYSNISSNIQSFDSSTPPYQEALKNSGYDYKLNFDPQPPREKLPRNRNAIWFNKYSVNVVCKCTVSTSPPTSATNFLIAIDECFPKNNPLNKILNRNTLKLSYSCMPNIQNIISSHNKLVITKATQHNTTTHSACRMRMQLLQKKGTSKTRYLNHTSSFQNEKRKHGTELSKHIWPLKQSNSQHSIRWKIIKKCQPYSNRTKRCNLCLYEKFIIYCHRELSSLNKRNELISICRHRKKHLLCNQWFSILVTRTKRNITTTWRHLPNKHLKFYWNNTRRNIHLTSVTSFALAIRNKFVVNKVLMK